MSRSYPALHIALHGPSEDWLGRLLAEIDDEQPTAVEDRDSDVRVFFSSPAARDRALRKLNGEPGVAVEPIDVADEDWAALSQSAIDAVRVGRLVVAPPWMTPTLGPGDLLVRIQPSMGFGTGHHATTRLCLQRMQQLRLTGASALDVGTGSGVLAIAAAKLGATRVLAIDNDPDALESAHANVQFNDVSDRVTLIQADVASGFSRTDSFDLLLANLTGAALARHAPALASLGRRGGHLVASGFELDEEADVAQALAWAGFRVANRADEDGWGAGVWVWST